MMTMEIHDNLAVFGENECIYQCVLDDFKNAKFIGIITFNISSSTNSQLVLQNTGAKTAELILYALLIRLGFFHFLTSLYYRVVVIKAPLQGLCYTVRDAVDW